VSPFTHPLATARTLVLKQQGQAENAVLAGPPAAGGGVAAAVPRCPFSGGKVPLRMVGGGRTHGTSSATAALLKAIGGLEKLKQITTRFYEKTFADTHLDQFVRSHDDPHAERLSAWIAEKMGGGTPWSDERRTRPQEVVEAYGGMRVMVHDRSSAHFAAWNSPKRQPQVAGDHFVLRDARVWMRLMFWSAREVGAFDGEAGKAFEDWYVKFIAHFVRVYEGLAPPFARESARWSLDPEATRKYLETHTMADVLAVSDRQAYAQLPAAERDSGWPYDDR
jgi:truncated hemoglobin YjbI